MPFIVETLLLAKEGRKIVAVSDTKGGIYNPKGLDEVNRQLQTVMNNAFQEVLEMSQHEKANMRDAAYMLAIKRLEEALNARGIFP